MALTTDELIERAQILFNKCKDASLPGAEIAMIELRNLVPELLDALRAAKR